MRWGDAIWDRVSVLISWSGKSIIGPVVFLYRLKNAITVWQRYMLFWRDCWKVLKQFFYSLYSAEPVFLELGLAAKVGACKLESHNIGFLFSIHYWFLCLFLINVLNLRFHHVCFSLLESSEFFEDIYIFCCFNSLWYFVVSFAILMLLCCFLV